MYSQMLHLARWLGPWASESSKPENVTRRTVRVQPRHEGERRVDAWLYAPTDRPVTGAYIVAPGFHFQGPGDRRMIRFCTILASSGILVLNPFMQDFLELQVTETSVTEFKRAFQALLELPELPDGVRPGAFSISFGSLLALRLVADPEYRDKVGGAMIFGGYANWNETLQFSLTGCLPDGTRLAKHDPLNQPVVYMNLLPYFEEGEVPRSVDALRAAWMRLTQNTWNQDRYRKGEHIEEVYSVILDHVPEDAREMFLRGVGAGHDQHARALNALANGTRTEAMRFLDPRPYLKDIRCPVYMVHGVDDDVIPVNQMDLLEACLPDHIPVRAFRTGLFGHSSAEGGSESIKAVVQEFKTMVQMLDAMVAAASDRALVLS